MSKLEEGARALFDDESSDMGLDDVWSAQPRLVHRLYEQRVRRVLECLLSPDEEIFTAAADTPGMKAASMAMEMYQVRGYSFDDSAFATGSPLQQAWYAMIQSILNQGNDGERG